MINITGNGPKKNYNKVIKMDMTNMRFSRDMVNTGIFGNLELVIDLKLLVF